MLLVPAVLLAILAYSQGIATGFASDDYGWLRQAVRGELGWDASFRLAGHSNALPFEIALYHLKFLLFGFNPAGYHLFSLAGHIINVFLLYLLARRLDLSAQLASVAAVLGAVMAAGAQAVYWMSGDPHVWATAVTLGALILYIDHRERGGWWRLGLALILAFVAPLVKAEGVAVPAGIVAYELIWRSRRSLSIKLAPFLLAPIPFVWWEWTTRDQLKTQRDFGLNAVVTGLHYLSQILQPYKPASLLLGSAAYALAAALALLLLVALRRRETYGLLLFGLAGTAPALVVTLGTQSRYVYFAGLLAASIATIGAWSLVDLLRGRLAYRQAVALAAVLMVAIIAAETALTVHESGSLRAAHTESVAFRSAVLSDHRSVPDGTVICIVGSPLDTGSATAVFADPRLGRDVGIPAVTKCESIASEPAGAWIYGRLPDGMYRQLR
jgi:4-amino-4-deoxy-L-arabinose transferase-like glycosyltransferase